MKRLLAICCILLAAAGLAMAQELVIVHTNDLHGQSWRGWPPCWKSRDSCIPSFCG